MYIVKDGILQLLYFDGEKEVTFGFAFPGTVLLSPHSFYMGKPAVMQVESCRIASAVMKIDKPRFEKLLEESHEFARWMLNLAIGQIYTSELKVTYVSGSAEDRYKSLLKIRPDIVTSVSANRLASYLFQPTAWRHIWVSHRRGCVSCAKSCFMSEGQLSDSRAGFWPVSFLTK